jgi:hypothetical protein
MNASNDLARARDEEIELTLVPRLQSHEGQFGDTSQSHEITDVIHPATTIDPEAEQKTLFNLTKRRVLAILKVQYSSDLEAVLALPVTEEDEDEWMRVAEEEEEEENKRMADQRHARNPSLAILGPTDDIRS